MRCGEVRLRMRQVVARLRCTLATCIKRVPRAREQGKALVPETLEVVVENLRAELPVLSGGDPARLEKLRTDLEAAYAKYRVTPPQSVLNDLRDPRPTQAMVDA